METPETSGRGKYRRIRKHSIRRWTVLGLLSAIAILLILLFSWVAVSQTPQRSSYSLSLDAPFNQVEFYPTIQPVSSPYYQSTGKWLGRLILPTPEQLQTLTPTSPIPDWVWIELYHTPPEAKQWEGKTLRLEWIDDPRIAEYVKTLVTNVKLSTEAKESQQSGNIIPTRLNNRSQVGPLQSLAGSRPQDNLIVRLERVTLVEDSTDSAILKTGTEPIQVTGRFYGLVKILQPLPSPCPEDSSCPSEWFRVQHYNQKTGQFDGAEETLRIPQQPLDNNSRYLSTPQNLENSPAGEAGWYIYGARDRQGQVIVQGIKPRSLFQLYPNRILLGRQTGLDYIQDDNWKDTPNRKGTTQSVLLSPTATRPEEAVQYWEEGDYALVMHLFGGIGGEKEEPLNAGTVTGHFSYGIAQIVRDPFTQELQFQILYQQVYAHNPNGIIAGTHAWTNYMGNLRSGWLGSRPVSDVLIKLDALTKDYNFQGQIISPMQEFLIQLQVMMARYRTGDGRGVAQVTPATSCVQDSSQALYITIEQIKQQISSNPKIVSWLRSHPNHPQTQRLSQLVRLGKDLVNTLSPQGVVREDWKNNAEFLSGVNGRNGFVSDRQIITALLSWQTLLPRSAYDQIAKTFFDRGAQLWFLRTNQVGGLDPTIEPLAPTGLLGQFPIIPILASRLLLSLARPQLQDWGILALMLGVYGVIAVLLGIIYSFTQWWKRKSFHNAWNQLFYPTIAVQYKLPWWNKLGRLLLSIALEELIFRVLLVPHPTAWISALEWWIFALVSLAIYLLYKFVAIRLQNTIPVSLIPVKLMLSTVLGLVCILTYRLTGLFGIVFCLHGTISLLTIVNRPNAINPNPNV